MSGLKLITKTSYTVGMMGLVLMALFTLVDIAGSKFLGFPLPGVTELVALVQIFAIAGGLAFSELEKRHVRVEILIMVLPPKGKKALYGFSYYSVFFFFALATWSSFEHASSVLRSGMRTALLGLPVAPFMFWTAFCCALMCVTVLSELVYYAKRG